MRTFRRFFLKFSYFFIFLNIQIDLITLETNVEQFTLTTKKSLHIIFNVCSCRSTRVSRYQKDIHSFTPCLCGYYRISLTRMWADAQRDGCPGEYRWRRLRKFHNFIPCSMPQISADARCSSAVQWRRKVNFARGKIPSEGKSPRKCSVPALAGDCQTSCKLLVCLKCAMSLQ